MTINKKNIAPILFLLIPGLFVYAFFVVYPILNSGYLSFFSFTNIANKKFVGFDNYIYVFNNSLFWKSMINSLKFMFLSTAIQLVVGFTLGYLVYLQVKGYQCFKVLLFVPTILPGVAVGFIWNKIFSPSMGIAKPIATALGLGEAFMTPTADPTLALYAIILAQVWCSCGVQIIMFNSGFMALPNEVIESATLDGAKGWTMIRRMIIPMSQETIKMVTILLLVGTLRAFDLVYVMTGGGPNHATEVLPMHLFVEAFKNFNYGAGSVVAVIIFFLAMFITVVMRRLMKTDSLY
ncbi:MAG: sugar ABC transporter permease [Faecalibacterium sp.]